MSDSTVRYFYVINEAAENELNYNRFISCGKVTSINGMRRFVNKAVHKHVRIDVIRLVGDAQIEEFDGAQTADFDCYTSGDFDGVKIKLSDPRFSDYRDERGYWHFRHE